LLARDAGKYDPALARKLDLDAIDPALARSIDRAPDCSFGE
jgi:hypothetical protein